MKNRYVGRWRIFEMEQWDQHFVDVEVPGYIVIKERRGGEFQFGLVKGIIDYRTRTQHSVRFSINDFAHSEPREPGPSSVQAMCWLKQDMPTAAWWASR